MRKLTIFTILLLVLLLSACQTNDEEDLPPPLLLAPPAVTAVATAQPTITDNTEPTAAVETQTETVVDTSNQIANVQTDTITCVKQTSWPVYTVQAGDTLGSIANRTGSTIAELTQANCLTNPSLLHVGNSLYVPNFPPTPIPPTAVPPGNKTFIDAQKRVAFQYPADWVEVQDGDRIRLEGESGYALLGLLGSGWNLQNTAQSEADHHLRPYGINPSITPFWLSDGREGRLILPSTDQNPGMVDQAALIVPYGDPVHLGDVVYNYLILYAHKDVINEIGHSLVIYPGQTEPVVTNLTVDIEDAPSGTGKLVTFKWDSVGATRATLHSGRAERFDSWWPVVPGGEMKVELANTIFPNPTATLHLINDINGRETFATFQYPWACQHAFFFPYETGRCPQAPATTVNGVYQNFEHGFMVWLPPSASGGNANLPQIYVFFEDSRVQLFDDTWTEGEPEFDDTIVPPENLYQPVRGFGKVWRENPAVRAQLGWATHQEITLEILQQYEIRESIPGVAYLQLLNAQIVKIIGSSRWENFP